MNKFVNKTPYCLTDNFRKEQMKYGQYEIPKQHRKLLMSMGEKDMRWQKIKNMIK